MDDSVETGSLFCLKDMEEPNWHNVKYKKPDFQAISYFSAPKTNKYKSLDEVDPELIKTFNKLGISIEEQKKLADFYGCC